MACILFATMKTVTMDADIEPDTPARQSARRVIRPDILTVRAMDPATVARLEIFQHLGGECRVRYAARRVDLVDREEATYLTTSLALCTNELQTKS
ncbi:hypothetical protein CSAL01_11651 [Colletotrichum salicis]|uniref:Uncharacterized protein n=1 Tax=Colletotrichum salicis TaxID=1209931 RepID=A0A135UIK5_9PEZI|nr:hypothetical protein CSAL01_11651 [Colletotrichum salicis]